MSSYILKSYFLCLFFCILPLIHPYSCFLSITWLLPATDLLFKSLTLLPGSLLAPGRASSLVSPDLDNVTSAVTDQEVPRLSVLNVPKWISTSWPNKWIICELWVNLIISWCCSVCLLDTPEASDLSLLEFINEAASSFFVLLCFYYLMPAEV